MTENNVEKKHDIKDILLPLLPQLDKVDQEIASMLKTGIPLLDQCAVHLFIKGGKKIRAAYVLLASGLYGGMPGGIIEIAASTEIVHAATLVHDDIIDQSILRRGDLTMSKKWGHKIAVLVGDYMYTKALDTVVKDGNPDLFSVIVAGTNDMVKGELYQLQYSGIQVINREHYMNLIELKTARFMAACAKLGGIKAGLSAEECGRLFEFGLNSGLAFQIVDDTLDFIDDKITGKDSGNDFRDGKVTLPFLHLLEISTAVKRDELIACAANPVDENWAIVKKELRESGSIEYSIQCAKKYIEKAFESLERFPESEYKNILMDIAGFFVHRNY